MDRLTIAIASQAVHEQILRAKFTFDSPPFCDGAFSFSVTFTNPTPPPATKTETVTGTFNKSGETRKP